MMEAAVFILLPEGSDIVDMVSKEGELESRLSSWMQVKQFARNQGVGIRVFYDLRNINAFIDGMNFILDDGAYPQKPVFVLKNFISSCSTNVQMTSLLDSGASYIQWDTKTLSSNPDVAVVVKNAFEESGNVCILSLQRGVPTDYYQVSIVKDREYQGMLPELKNIPLFFSGDSCIEWILSLQGGKFSLRDNPGFLRTAFHWNNQQVYKKADDGTYWYFDWFHKDNIIHYEVFDGNGEHIGIATESGVFQEGTAEKDKSISHLLHGR